LQGKMDMKGINRGLLYVAYTLIAIGGFLYFLFPSETFKGAVSAYLLKRFPDYQVQIARLTPVLPPGLGFESISVLQGEQLYAQLDRLRLTPSWTTLFSPRKVINLRGVAYQGSLRGQINVNEDEKGTQADLGLKLTDLQLGAMANLQEKLGKALNGRLSGDVEIDEGRGSNRSIKGRLDASDVRFALANPIININEILLNMVKAEFAVNKKVFSVKRLEATGGQVEGNLTGTIMLRKPFEKSRINLRGSFLPQEVLLASFQGLLPGNLFQQRQTTDKGMPIRIYGTIEKPRFSFR